MWWCTIATYMFELQFIVFALVAVFCIDPWKRSLGMFFLWMMFDLRFNCVWRLVRFSIISFIVNTSFVMFMTWLEAISRHFKWQAYCSYVTKALEHINNLKMFCFTYDKESRFCIIGCTMAKIWRLLSHCKFIMKCVFVLSFCNAL